MRPPLQAALEEAKTLAQEALLEFLGELEQVRIVAMARFSAPPATPPDPDHLLSVKQAAQRVGFSASYLYHHPDEFPFLTRRGRRVLASSRGIDAYIAQMS